MKSAGIVKVSGVRNVGNVTRYNEQEKKISGKWHGQDHQYTPPELCTYQGAAENGGPRLREKGTAFIRNGVNNARLYHLLHPRGHANLTMARTFVQSFDYSLNPQLSPGDVHAMGEMFSDELRHYFQDAGRPINDALISTHLDRAEPKISEANQVQVLQPHLHNHIVTHSFNHQGQSLAPLLKKSNLHDFQELNDDVVDRFDLKDYRFAKLQRLIFPMSAKTDYRNRIQKGSLSNLGLASQRFLNANRSAKGHYPHDFKRARRYRDRLLRSNFGYRTKEVADLRSATSRQRTSHQVFTMKDFVGTDQRPIWYGTKNLRLLPWRNRRDATVERFITRLDFNRAINATPTHREYQRTMRYAAQADSQGHQRVQRMDHPRLRMRPDPRSPSHDRESASPHIQYYRNQRTGKHSYLISLRSIFQRVRKEEEKIKHRTNAYVRKIKARLQHVRARMARRRRAKEARHSREMADTMGSLHHREDEVYQYITIYGTNRRGKVQSYRMRQRIHPRATSPRKATHHRRTQASPNPQSMNPRKSPRRPPKRKPHMHW